MRVRCVPVAPAVPPPLAGRLFRGSDVVARGLLTRRQLDSRAWQRLYRDVYLDASVPVTHELRARAAALVAVPGAVVSGASAAVLWGVPLVAADDPVECTVSPGRPASRDPALRLRRRSLADADVTTLRGARVTTPVRTALDLAGRGPLEDAVVVLDRFAQQGLLTLSSLRRTAAADHGRGCRQAWTAAVLADGRAESPQETRVRLVLHGGGLPRPTAQYEVRDAHGLVARVDFGWPELRVAVEYDGQWHGEAGQFTRDRRRLNRLTAAGWTVVFVTAPDLHHPADLVARVAAALDRARRQSR